MKTMGIVARPDLSDLAPTVRELVGWLESRHIEVCLDAASARLTEGMGGPPRQGGPRGPAEHCEALVVLGGDGTLLAASRLLERQIPVLGVNFGGLGFLTDIALGEMYPTIEALLAGRYAYEDRRLLHASIRRHREATVEGDALNDIVITKAGTVSRIIELEVSIDGHFVSSFGADGLIVSSPTGSTAYNLAAGGPILSPSLPAVVLTLICPHMLTNRPLVVADSSTIEVSLRASRGVEVLAAIDGQQALPLADGDSVVVTRSERCLRLVKAAGRDYYQVLRTKLKWGERGRTSA
jgi:NAD+ kinase